MQELGDDGNIVMIRRTAVVFLLCVLAARAGGQESARPREMETKSGVVMIELPGGWFTMGNPKGSIDEKPHRVCMSPFRIDKYKVSQAEYEKVMAENPSRWKGEKNPVEQIRWSDAVNYCNARSRLDGLEPCYDIETWQCDFSANGYRLPTEAEWEYAARAGTETKYFFDDKPTKLKLYAWYKKNSRRRARPLGQKLPNPWGLHDMYGDVWEWCHDIYKVDYYQESPEKDPRGPAEGETRVLRGGCWNSSERKCCSSFRYNEDPGYTDPCFGYDIYGFRCVRSAGASR